jgi:DNA replication protein DnaC
VPSPDEKAGAAACGLVGDGAAEDLLGLVMRRYERASTLLTPNRPIEGWGKLLGDAAAITALLDRLLHHGHVFKCGPRRRRTKPKIAKDKTLRTRLYELQNQN